MPKANKFTVQVNSVKGLTSREVKKLESAINGAVKNSIAELDFKGKGLSFKRPNGLINGIVVDLRLLR